MRIVHAPIDGMQKLLRAKVFNSDIDYAPTRYCLDVACDEGRLLYNTLTGELVLLESSDTTDLLMPMLVQKHFFVSPDFDEFKYVQQLKTVVGLVNPPTSAITSFTILTTTKCNARCYYCYERGITRKTMSQPVAIDVARYIADACRGEEVSIHWFGGEPLYNSEAIDTLSGELSSIGVPFSSHMTSNGFYFDDGVIERARQNWHLEYVQITIDGTESVYNRTKSYIDAQGSSYQRVLSNIEHALDAGIEVYVRLNMDSSNSNDLRDLCDELAHRFSGRKGLRAIVVPLVSLVEKVHEFDTPDDKVQHYKDLFDRLIDAGLAYFSELPQKLQLNRCIADSMTAEVIMPDGQIAKCDQFEKEEFIGDIYSPWRDEKAVASWAKRAELRQECRDCPLFPSCTPLERCPWDKAGCDEALRAMRLYKLEKRIITAFERYKDKE